MQHHLRISLICLILRVILTKGQDSSSCGVDIAEEGKEISIKCDSQSTLHQNFTWQVAIGKDRQNISLCSMPEGTCKNLMQESFIATVRNGHDDAGSVSYISELKVKSVSRNKTSFYCVKHSPNDAAVETQACDLQVYVKPEKPYCKDLVLEQFGAAYKIKVECGTDNVYPEGDCYFISQNIPMTTRLSKILWNHPSSKYPGDYATECLLLASVEGLDEGIYQYQPQAWPNLNGYRGENTSTFGDWLSIFLNYTTINLAPDCPSGVGVKDGYIMAGTAATCRCQVEQAGYPPGYAQWNIVNNDTRSMDATGTFNSTDKSSTITLEYDITNQRPKYWCEVVSALKRPTQSYGGQFSIPYTPRFAFGPTLVETTVPEPPVFDLCPMSSQTFVITCGAPKDDVSPSPLFTLIINDETVKEKVNGQLVTMNNHYLLSYYHRPNAGGITTVLCSAMNQIFPDKLHVEVEKRLEIREPPPDVPVMKISGNEPTSGSDVAYVRAGSNVYVTCRVDGGFPNVENVTIVCGIYMNIQHGSSVALSFKLADDFSGMECTCSAQHISGCYDKWTQIALRLQESDAGTNNSTNMESSTKSDGIDTVGIGLCVGLGLALLIIVIGAAFIVIQYRKRKKSISELGYDRPGSFKPNPTYDEHTYQSTAPGGPPRYPLPPIPESDDYDILPLQEDPGLRGKDKVKDGDCKAEADKEDIQPDDKGNKQQSDQKYTRSESYSYPVENEYLQPVDYPPIYVYNEGSTA